MLLSCSAGDSGCEGGTALSGFDYMNKNEITEETCASYRAKGFTNGLICSPINICKNCKENKSCFVPDSYHIYKIDQYSFISGESDMLQEIYQRGPIACGIAIPDDLKTYTGGIY